MPLTVDSRQLPMGWEVRKLGEVCQIKPPKEEARQKLSETDLVSFVPMSNLGIQSKIITLNENKLLSEVIGSYTYFADNDVLLAKITPCFENGKLSIAQNLTNGVGFGSSEYIVFRSKGTIEPEYLFYFLSQDSFRNSGAFVMTGAVGHKRVPKDFIENHPILLPPLPEQKQIVAILDEAFEGIDRAIALAEKNLANSRELFESYLNAIFTQKGDGWEIEKLGEICHVVGGGTPSKSNDEFYTGEIPWATVRDMKSEIIYETECRITEEAVKKSSTKIIKQGNVVIATRVGLGKVCMVAQDTAINQDLKGIIPKNNNQILIRFLFWWLKSIASLIKEEGTGATVQGVKVTFVSSLKIPVLPLSKQKDIVTQLDDISAETQRLETIYRQKIAALKELKQSILQKAFTGELTSATVEKAA
jgi:type I restriction enzyme S subunit